MDLAVSLGHGGQLHKERERSVQAGTMNRDETQRTLKRKLPDYVQLSSQRLKSINSGSYDGQMIPPGWLDCPAYGQPIGCIIPSKVPLSESFNEYIPGERYTPKHVIHQQRLLGRELGLVIDLTNTDRYYPLSAWSDEGIKHIKIRCKGRDSVPDDASVDKFVYEVLQFSTRQTDSRKYILVHCTHGHNRTGYMIAHFLRRTESISIAKAIEIFARARHPGIYKQDYVDSLYMFYHEKKPEISVCPKTPVWKRPLDSDFNREAVQGHNNNGSTHVHGNYARCDKMTNDDVMGEAIPYAQQQELQQICYKLLNMGAQARGNLQFPGSHPVSLNRDNFLLMENYYYATWKADGTRYMMLITWDGCYLIDRNFKFRRVEMRFPCKQVSQGMPETTLNYTLLDGEMVIDTDKNTLKQERRYLIYDMMAINQDSIVQMPFNKRWKLIEDEVIKPRNMEREALSKSLNPYYRYDLEPFSLRRKGFWLLSTVTKLLKKFIPGLSHESDGLIFQKWDDVYVPRTDYGLLKWKYAHMNSVDFLFELGVHNRQLMFLHERGKKKLMEGDRVVFNDASDPSFYSGKIIECCWDSERKLWVFMRIRTDKSTPNDFNTYMKVLRSIRDNITEEALINEIDEIICLPRYMQRMRDDMRAHELTISARRK